MGGRNVVLTGFMGTGKTTVGRVLAERLHYAFVDTDQVITERHGPIPVIFDEHGEEHFRSLERQVAGELGRRSGLVIGTGGRLMLDPVNAETLGTTGDVVCLTASIDTILERVDVDGAAATRPLLAGDDVRGRLEALLAERSEAYGRFAQISTDHRSPGDVADAIVRLLGRD